MLLYNTPTSAHKARRRDTTAATPPASPPLLAALLSAVQRHRRQTVTSPRTHAVVRDRTTADMPSSPEAIHGRGDCQRATTGAETPTSAHKSRRHEPEDDSESHTPRGPPTLQRTSTVAMFALDTECHTPRAPPALQRSSTAVVSALQWGSPVLQSPGHAMPEDFRRTSHWTVPFIHAAFQLQYPAFDQTAAFNDINGVNHNVHGNFNHLPPLPPGFDLARHYVACVKQDLGARGITPQNWMLLFDVRGNGYVAQEDQERLLFPINHVQTKGFSRICDIDSNVFARIEVALSLLVLQRYSAAVDSQHARMAAAAAHAAASGVLVQQQPASGALVLQRDAATSRPAAPLQQPSSTPTGAEGDGGEPNKKYVGPTSTTGKAFTLLTYTKAALYQVLTPLTTTSTRATHCFNGPLLTASATCRFSTCTTSAKWRSSGLYPSTHAIWRSNGTTFASNTTKTTPDALHRAPLRSKLTVRTASAAR